MIKEGDVVRLKSGGPKMTVSRIGSMHSDPYVVKCTWFNEDVLYSAWLNENSLEIIWEEVK